MGDGGDLPSSFSFSLHRSLGLRLGLHRPPIVQSGKLKSKAACGGAPNAEISAPRPRGPLLDALGRPAPNPSRAATIPAIPTSAQGSPADRQVHSQTCTHPARPPDTPGSPKSGSRHHCPRNAPASALVPDSPPRRAPGVRDAERLPSPFLPPERGPLPGLLHLRKPSLAPGGPTRPPSGSSSVPQATPRRARPEGSPRALGPARGA